MFNNKVWDVCVGMMGINQEELVEEEGAPEAPTPAMEGQTRAAPEQ